LRQSRPDNIRADVPETGVSTFDEVLVELVRRGERKAEYDRHQPGHDWAIRERPLSERDVSEQAHQKILDRVQHVVWEAIQFTRDARHGRGNKD